MDEITSTEVTSIISNIDTSDRDAESDNYVHEIVSSTGEGMRESVGAGEVLTRLELDLAYSAEKLLNLDILLMHVSAKESDYEALTPEDDSVWADSAADKGLQFVLLSGILDTEVREIQSFMASLQTEIVYARQKVCSCDRDNDSFEEMEEKLKDLEKSFKQSENIVTDMRLQSAKFQRIILSFGEEENWNNSTDAYFAENGQFSPTSTRLKMQTAEQQRHILRMLEKSLARELDMEKKLSDSRNSEEELRRKLHTAEHELLCMEEAAEVSFERLFEAENAAVVLMGISKQILGQLQLLQFNMNGSVQREEQMGNELANIAEQLKTLEMSSSELDKSLSIQTNTSKISLKEAEEKYNRADSEALALKEKVHTLEEKVKESEIQLENAKASIEESEEHTHELCAEITEMENQIDDLKKNISGVESKAENLEAKCKLLSEINLELNEELGLFKNNVNNTEKVSSLEKQLNESDIQLQHARASAEASYEKQSMLNSAIRDMEDVIEDLKSKVAKAENRALSAEVKCTMLSETNMELNEELTFLRGRTECLETSLHQGDEAKSATAKDISIRTKLITDLVLQLAFERERLKKQITSLTRANRVLAEKSSEEKNGSSTVASHAKNKIAEEPSPMERVGDATRSSNTSEEEVPQSFASHYEVKEPSVSNTGVVEPVVCEEDDDAIDTVRTIDATQLSFKYYLLAILVFFISVLVVYLSQQEKGQF
ncbi:WPP domain-interacting tail-anchored protein 1-like isoform X1 [Papaver somniferum]|uniref:WPP domain-interacting tail-anchored protein 1-like isoform X1 n=2 Tax=Papaver somniferum TaxID=3469 RepID=UPI000E6FC87A|nr:WPP domain-interacting tail-anchored protein 1-like isoform X1 [Papaver somniferum]